MFGMIDTSHGGFRGIQTKTTPISLSSPRGCTMQGEVVLIDQTDELKGSNAFFVVVFSLSISFYLAAFHICQNE
jgi:hypothetical protein